MEKKSNKDRSMGTPKTLEQAILNGLATGDDMENMHNHIKDFLSQKFMIANLKNMSAMELWDHIFQSQKVKA